MMSEVSIARMPVNARYQIAHDKVIAEMNIEHLEPLTTEDDILAAATRLTKRKRNVEVYIEMIEKN